MLNEQWKLIMGLFESHKVLIGWLGGLSLLVFVGSLIAIPLVIAWLPKDYLHKEHKWVQDLPRHIYLPFLVLKNILGILFLLSGLAMLILPGQGLLTLFIGLVLLDFPRKRILIRRILSNAFIFRNINRIRTKLRKPKLDPP